MLVTFHYQKSVAEEIKALCSLDLIIISGNKVIAFDTAYL
jgi:hypothetical protein